LFNANWKRYQTCREHYDARDVSIASHAVGTFVQNMTTAIQKTEDGYVSGAESTVKHAAYIEHGTGPHSQKSTDTNLTPKGTRLTPQARRKARFWQKVLEPWVRLRMGVTDSKRYAIALSIGRRIEREGMKPRRPFARAEEEHGEEIAAFVRKVAGDGLEALAARVGK